MNDIKVLVFTKYDNKGASSRLRSIQYFEGIENAGIELEHSPLFDDSYLDKLYNDSNISKFYILKRYIKRFLKLFQSKKYNLLWVEKELFPWLPFNIEGLLVFFGIRYIVDYDDAIFHNYDQHRLGIVRYFLSNKIPNVMRNAKLVTVCNAYLKHKALKFEAKKVELVPTVVDLNRYTPVYKANNDILTIGWIGTPKTEKYIINLIGMFDKLSEEIDFKVVVIGGQDFKSAKFKYEILPWSEDKEVEYLQKIDIGIMPLDDSKWEKGKCGYKLIQYMACGKPVIASKVGMNCKIIEDGKNGFLVSKEDEWIDSFKKLSIDKDREKIGKKARENVVSKYSVQITLNDRIRFIDESI